MDRPGSFRRYVTGNSVRPGELPKEPSQAIPIAFDRRITFGVRPFEIAVRHQPRTTVTGADDINHIQIVLFDQSVQVDINEVETGGGTPVAQQTRLDVLELERGFEQGIVLQINLPNRKIVRRAP